MTFLSSRLRQAAIAASMSIGMFAVGAANAAGTDAGTSVSNTFTLDYEVGGTGQPQINNSGTPTLFTVDRRVDLTVSAVDQNGGTQGTVDTTPGASGQQLVWGVRNDGNDTQAYSLTFEDVAADDFDATQTLIQYYPDAGGDGLFTAADLAGAPTVYNGTNTTDVLEDATIWVVVTYNLVGGETNGQLDEVILLADTLDPVTWSVEGASGSPPGTQTVGDTNPNNIVGVAQNVLADGTGTSATDANNQGDHSATAGFNVGSADLTAGKTVGVIATDGASIACATDPIQAGNQYAVPGACIEYVITASNAGTAAQPATNIDIGDVMPTDVAYVGATQSGFTTAGTLGTTGSCPNNPCTVTLTGAVLNPGVSGTLTIRATVR